MPPRQLVVHRRIDTRRLHAAVAGRGLPAGIAIAERPIGAAVDAVAAILGAGQASGPGGVGRVSVAGLLAGLTGTPRRHVRLWIATHDQDGAVGLASLTESATHFPGEGGHARMSIGWLIVMPAHRRGGLGLALLAEVAAAALRHGVEQLHAEVHSRWEDARRFWDRVEALAANASES